MAVRQNAAAALALAAFAGCTAVYRAAAFVSPQPCSQALAKGASAPFARAQACSGAEAVAGTGAGALLAVGGLLAAAAGRASRKPAAKGKKVALQATLDAPETAAVETAPASFCFAGASAPPTAASVGRQSSVARNLLMPKNIKMRKPFKPVVKPFHHSTKWKFKGYVKKLVKPYFGRYALQCLEECWISNRCIEECRRRLTRTMERRGKVFIRVFPDRGITERVLESRMGAGKGNIAYWVAAVRPLMVAFEIDGVPEETATLAFRKVSFLLPCKSRMLIKQDGPSMYELGLAGVPKRNRDPRAVMKTA